MTHDPALAQRARRILRRHAPDVSERQMMGCLVFMVGEAMCCGVQGERLMLRLGPDGARQAQADPRVQPMKVGSRRTSGFVTLHPDAVSTDAELEAWVSLALGLVAPSSGRPTPSRPPRRRR